MNVSDIMPSVNSFLVSLHLPTGKLFEDISYSAWNIKFHFEDNWKTVGICWIESVKISLTDLIVLHFMKCEAFHLRINLKWICTLYEGKDWGYMTEI